MKKFTKSIIIAILVLSLTLGVFAGCEPTDNKTLTEKYGISMNDKSLTYDGEKHTFGVSVDNTILQGKSYEVTYEYNGAVLTKAEFTDAGKYALTAKVKVEGDETVYPLTANFTIKKAPLTLEVGNLFLRQGQGIATLGNPRDLFKNADFIGTDTSSILGTLSFEIYNGASKVNDISTLKPSASVSNTYTAKVTGIKDLTNYEVKLNEGKLYVLSGAEFDTANALKDEIATVPSATTINTLDYYSMRAFAMAADHIVSTYPSTTEIQRLMCGTVNVDSVKTLKKTADQRINMVYDFDKDIETAVGTIIFQGAEHIKNDARAKEDKFSEFKNNVGSRSKVEYNDVIAFDVVIYDATKYQFSSVLINGVEFTPTSSIKGSSYISTDPKITDKSVIYRFGDAYTTDRLNSPDDGYGYSKDKNPGVISGIEISNKLLGALDGKSTLTIKPIVGEIYGVGVYKGNLEIKNKEDMPELSNITITSKGSTDYNFTSDLNKTKTLMDGKEYKFTITTNVGYRVVSVEIGDEIILANAMDNGSFTITLGEKHVSTIGSQKVVKIVPEFERVYSFEVKAQTEKENIRTLPNTNKDGVFTHLAGTIKLGGVSSTTVPTIAQDKPVNVTITPEDGWMLTKVIVYQGNNSITPEEGKYIDITDEFEGNSSIYLDLAENKFKFITSKEPIIIIVNFRESYPISVQSTYDDKTTKMSQNSSGQFTSTFGNVEILNTKREPLSTLADGALYYIRLEPKEGYVPKKVKVNGKVIASYSNDDTGLGDFNEGKRYSMIKKSSNIIVYSKTQVGYSAQTEIENSSIWKNGDKYPEYKYPIIVAENLNAGDTFTVEVEYESYYFVSVDKSIPADASWQVQFGMLIVPDSDGGYKVSTNPTSGETIDNNNKKSALYNAGDALIKVDSGSTFYCYKGTAKIYARILESTKTVTDKDGGTSTLKFLDPIITIGCDGNYWGTSTAGRQYYTSVEDAIKVPAKVANEISRYVQKTAIKPGETILISFIADYEYK